VVLFLDSDDWLYPEAVARAVTAFGPGVAKVQFRLHLVDGSGNRIDLFPAPEITFDDGDVVPLLLTTGRYETTVTSGHAFARSVLHAILPVPEGEFRISADGYLVTVAPLFGRVVSIEEPLGAYVLHGGNNWTATTGAGLAERLRRSLAHDLRCHEALRLRATERNLVVAKDLGLRDSHHLSFLIGSLTIDPANHPCRSDSRLVLALRGAWASRRARLPPARRLLLAAWFLAVGSLPRIMGAHLVSWRMSPATRPALLRESLRKVRSWLR
jgi:hypothetical protein